MYNSIRASKLAGAKYVVPVLVKTVEVENV